MSVRLRRRWNLTATLPRAYVLRASQEVLRKDYQAALTDSYLAERLDRGSGLPYACPGKCAEWLEEGLARPLPRSTRRAHASHKRGKLSTSGRGLRWGVGDKAAALQWSAETLAGAPHRFTG